MQINRQPSRAKDLTRALRERAGELGLDLLAVAPAEPPPHRAAFRSWIEAGHAGEMGYLARNADRRLDPQLVLPGARSIICAASNYGGAPEPEPPPHRGRFARYARGDDYHDFLHKRLTDLLDHLRLLAGHPVDAKVYVDTGPVLERDVAARAGLGWIGKNTCLIHPRVGSWLLLGVILTDLELEVGEPTPLHCGRCVRCLDVCPTGAFAGPYVLDSRRCISYLTIELKGPIPRELRPLIGNWVFGCDLCQDVCPFNRKAPETRLPEFRPRPVTDSPELVALLRMTEEEFREAFRGSPVKRTKRRGLLRNVAVALGNTGDRGVVPALAAALEDVEPLVRGHAAWALGRLGGPEATEALARHLPAEESPYVREEVVSALREAVTGTSEVTPECRSEEGVPVPGGA